MLLEQQQMICQEHQESCVLDEECDILATENEVSRNRMVGERPLFMPRRSNGEVKRAVARHKKKGGSQPDPEGSGCSQGI